MIDKRSTRAYKLKKENKRLIELCNKYEEEHKTAFKLWTMKMEEIPTYEEKIEMQNEIERLNNIINELEKYINETKLEEFEKIYGKRYGKTFTQAEVIICNMILNKLQELKGSNDNG